MINLQLVDVVATAALRAGLVDVDLWVWASWSSTGYWPGLGRAAAPPGAAGRCGGHGRAARRPGGRGSVGLGQLVQHRVLARPGRRRRPQPVDELDQDLQLVVVPATAALRAGLVDVDLRVWAS
ncbi:hypothetical protein A4F85_01125 [Delftia sp. GW456-R20]|uniref:hypothetical protein n=1 Tax=Delftia sp. GW456-R20 TaxID=1827145 RepID=UPI0007AE79CB|nr:hypothetical protein [Delftia sp. GW456-R20]KZK32389.1 hypothetical protein A4F85_01125 [Delftia sp. GW456-R20]